MQLLLAIVCAAAGVWFLVGGIASFVAPSDAVPSSGTNVVLGGVLLLVAFQLWRSRSRTVGKAAPSRPASSAAPRGGDWLAKLPAIDGFRRAAQSLAALDAVLSPDWEDRCYSYDASWSEGEQLASMRGGSGDGWFARITRGGIVVHGLAHESADFVPGAPKPWVFGQLPPELGATFLAEPAFDTANSTFCLWRSADARQWSRGPVPATAGDDGAHEQLEPLWAGAVGYHAWAEDYYEVALELADVEAFFRHEPVTLERARRMNPSVDFVALQKELSAIGYPAARA
jgi:hypothetical protein